MAGETSDSTAPVVSDAPRPSLGALFARLMQEGEAFIRAEVLLYRAQATRKAFSAGLIVALVGGAIMLVQALIVAVLIGIILTIAPLVGMGWAVLIVTAGTLVLIAVCGFVARAKISALLKPEEAR
jgi:hypothetical protein